MQFKALPLLAFLLAALLCTASDAGLKVPASFAFITVTHTRGQGYGVIQRHIQRYAAMDCPLATELNIVWNNEVEPEKAHVRLDRTAWKRPVNFLKTPNNSMDWRYKIPSESTAEVFFIVDDDVVLDCEELQRGFKVWQANAVGSVGPIVTYEVRYFEYLQRKGFEYGRRKEEVMFTMGLVGVSFMSRHFMELYYAPLPLLEQMREVVRLKNNCDDIALNWLVQYFYPELETVYVSTRPNLLLGNRGISQSNTPTHYPFRNQCLLAFTNLFGVNALRYKPITDEGDPAIRIKPLREEVVMAKRKYLDAIIKGQAPSEIHLEDLVGSEKAEEQERAMAQLQSSLLEARAAAKKLEESYHVAVNSSTAKEEELEKQAMHKAAITEILSVSIVILLAVISCLIYKLVGLTHENKFLHLRDSQLNAVDAGSSEEAELISNS